MADFCRSLLRCYALLSALHSSSEALAASGGQRAEGSFDVHVDLVASWPEVGRSALELEWAKRLGADAAAATLRRLVSPGLSDPSLDTGSSVGSAFGSLLVANRFFSPAVEAQRAGCRALSKLHGHPCNGSAFGVVGSSDSASFACEPLELERLLFRSSPGVGGKGQGTSHQVLSSADLVLLDTSFGGLAEVQEVAVICGCLEDPLLSPLLRWALETAPAKASAAELPVALAFRQGDCKLGASGEVRDELLSGYAVELRIKSSEYKATDDVPEAAAKAKAAKIKSEDSEAEEDSEEEDDVTNSSSVLALLAGVEVSGVNLERLGSRYPSLARELAALRELLEADSGAEAEELQRWELEDLGLKLAQRVRRSPEPLRALASSTENFPATMASLARGEAVRPRWRRASQRLGSAGQLGWTSAQAVELDGKPFSSAEDLATIYPLLNNLLPRFLAVAQLGEKAERAVAQLQQLERQQSASNSQPAASTSKEKGKKASTQQTGGGLGSAALQWPELPRRLDWRSTGLHWSYNVRSDEEADDWSQRLSALGSQSKEEEASPYHGMFGGQDLQKPKPLQIQQPVFSIVFAFDPLDSASVALALNLTGFSRPARVALLPVADAARTVQEGLGEPSLSRALSDAFGWILKVGGKADAAAARKLLAALKAQPVTSISEVEGLVKKHLPKPRRGSDGSWPKVVGASIGASYQAYLKRKGLPVPSLMVNGKVLVGSSAQTLQQGLSAVFLAEEFELREAVREKKLRDAKSAKQIESALEDFLLGGQSGGVASFYDPVLTPGISVSSSQERVGLVRDQGPENFAASFPGHMGMPSPSRSKSGPALPLEAAILPDATVATLPIFQGGGGRNLDKPVLSEHLVLQQQQHQQQQQQQHQYLVLFLLRPAQLPLLGFFADFLEGKNSSGIQLAVAAAPLGAGWRPCSLAVSSCLEAGSLESLRKAATCCSSDVVNGKDAGTEDACCVPASSVDGAADRAAAVAREFGAAEALWRQLPKELRSRVGQARGSSGAVAVCNGAIAQVPATAHAPEMLRAHWCPRPVTGLEAGATATAVAMLRSAQGPGGGGALAPRSVLQRCTEDGPKALKMHLRPKDAGLPVLARLAATVDPLSEAASGLAPLARLVHEELNAEVCVALVPRPLDDYPLKRWRRSVFVSGRRGEAPAAVFARLKTRHTLTVALIAPPSWLVSAHSSEQDLDNIRAVDAVLKPDMALASHGGGRGGSDRPQIAATFLLSGLYLEGSVYVEGSENAATGLHLELQRTDGAGGVHLDSSSESSCGNADTRVMRNLGFWSMPACPGTFQLSLAPGASNDTFELVRGSPGSMEDVEVTSFTLANLPLKVRVRPGRQESDLASKTLGTAKRRSRWKRASTRHLNAVAAGNATAGGKVAEAQVEALPTIHVFSLASGHMYERLLSIMVMSVRNHTRCPLHFWLVSNFLSPQFTTLLPQLEADMEGVTFHLVSFKWPSWLNPQQEKQRLIWAYKILFLDVLFPMDVPRVIFVDSDLVVRADLRELWDLDMQGRAYGFTPFCNGHVLDPSGGDKLDWKNTNTTGFRFWESGYWQSHLGPSPYHISALFVVDLLEFRRQSVGDELRATYNQLTRDPGSLANLDQDLPNYAQHSIPIFSLPQEWLWCESWCSQPTKHLAKAIDLCQNPLTKEPKIAMARRVIPEWEGYHRRVLALQAGAVEAVQQVNSEAAAGRRQEL